MGPLVAAVIAFGDEGGSDRPALQDLALVVVGPAVVADAGAGEVDHGVDAVEGAVVDAVVRHRPTDLVVAGGATNDGNHVVTVVVQPTRECCSDEAGRPGDRNAHVSRVRPIPATRATQPGGVSTDLAC